MSEKILSINSGSSSLKFKLFDMPDERVIASGVFERLGFQESEFSVKHNGEKTESILPISSHEEAVSYLLDLLLKLKMVHSLDEIRGVGHRVAHGGEAFKHSIPVGAAELKTIEQLSDLAPLHNPINAVGIRLFSKALPNALQVAVFDTSFHQTMPKENFLYPIPYKFYEHYKIRKYGFHGTSHEYVASEAACLLGKAIGQLKIVTCHLGNGASICGIDGGRSIDTSMGFTPTAGLMMGTRSGDLDPTVLTYIQRKLNLTTDETERIVNLQSGIMGVSGVSNDFRDVEQSAKKGDQASITAIRMFVRRICNFILAYTFEMGGLDALVFTAGIGEHSSFVRKEVCDRLRGMNLFLNEEKNRNNERMIQSDCSAASILVIPTDEELVIARKTFVLLREEGKNKREYHKMKQSDDFMNHRTFSGSEHNLRYNEM
ncbi:MAG: acetate/propionate family kinase [Sporolactobacillus sp.]